eukprot:jgi/Ulvmu1/11903/UM081_0062.1
MELHHKLRRDPNWHPNACNICGGMGHQAAQCKTGTIPWRQVFGDEAFVVRKPVFWTDVLAKRNARKVDHEKLAADAVAYARQACEAQGKDYDGEVVPVAQSSQNIDTTKLLENLRAEVEVKEKEAKIAADPTANLPPGWNVAYDPKGKPYYWHKETQKTQWSKPTADSATS